MVRVEKLKGTGSHWRRAALIAGVILAGVIVARAFGFTAYLRLENLSRLTETIEGYGVLGPVIYIAAYVLGVVFFVPGLPMTLLGGLAFGPVRGAAYVWIAATIGAALAFLVARYGLRGLVEGWVARNARLTRMDEAVARKKLGDLRVYYMNEQRGASNAKAKREFNWQPAFPSWRTGFEALYLNRSREST